MMLGTTNIKFTQFIYFCEMPYMFQEVPPPIIRSSKLYIQHRYLVKPLLLSATVVKELELLSSNSSMTVAGSSKGLTEYLMLYIQF